MELKFWPLEGHPRLMAMPDAALRTNSDKSSQRAMVIFMSEPRKEKSRNSRGYLIFFESTKIKRTTLSTTVAELYALMKCYGTCQMLRGLIKDTSRAARGGGGSFKNRKRIGEIGCCESRMTKRKH